MTSAHCPLKGTKPPQGSTLGPSLTAIALPFCVASSPTLEGKQLDCSLSLWGKALGDKPSQVTTQTKDRLSLGLMTPSDSFTDGGKREKSGSHGQNPDHLCLRNQSGPPSSQATMGS